MLCCGIPKTIPPILTYRGHESHDSIGLGGNEVFVNKTIGTTCLKVGTYNREGLLLLR